MINLLFHIVVLLVIIDLFNVKYKQTQLNIVFSTIFSFALGVLALAGFTGAGLIAGAAVMGVLGAALIYGGVALGASYLTKSSYSASSPTYNSGTKQTQTNPDLPVPLLYGEVKVAGNRVWQDDKYSNGIKRIVAFSDGEIEDFTEIKINELDAYKQSGIKIEKFFGTSTQELPSLWYNKKRKTYDYSELGSLKHLAYLYVKVNRGTKIDTGYNLTTVIKGRKIRVYTTPTQYTVKYSNNPAWVMFDFLTCYNGRGLCLKSDGTVDDNKIAELFDMQSFIESAAYCDQLIPYTKKKDDGTTTTEYIKRFTFNMIFDSQTSHKTLIDEIQRNCRGGLFTKEGKLQFKIDKAEVVSKVFTEADILDGSETFQTLPNEENYEVLKIDYISPEHEWQKVQAYAEIETNGNTIPIEHTVNAYSVTNFQQASRLAWYYLNSKRLCPYFGSFKTGFKAYDLEVGQVIEIPVILMGLKNYKVKVTSVVNNGTGTYTVNYRTYDERLYNDELGCKEPRVLVVDFSKDYGVPDDVTNFNVIQRDNYYMLNWQYTNDPNNTFEIRMGDSWDNGEVIVKRLYTNSYSLKIQTLGIKKFWIKSYNGYNYSENATLDVINIDSIPELNVIETFDLFENFDGTFDGTKFYIDAIKLETNQTILWENTNNKWGFDTYYQQDGNNWGAKNVLEGFYTTKIYDLVQNGTSIISRTYNYTAVDNDSNCVLEWRYSEDNDEWTEWTELFGGSFTFQYCQFRIHITSPNGTQVFCKNANIVIDVPDKFETYDVEVTDNVQGAIVEYSFYNTPSIVASVNDNINAYAVITSKTEKAAIVKIYNNDGSETVGKVSLYLKGY